MVIATITGHSAAATCSSTPAPTQGSPCYSTTTTPTTVVCAWSAGMLTTDPLALSVLLYPC